MAVKDYLPSPSSAILIIGAVSSLATASGVALGMIFNSAFYSFILNLTVFGLSIGSLGLPTVASIAIATMISSVVGFSSGVTFTAAASCVRNILNCLNCIATESHDLEPSKKQNTNPSNLERLDFSNHTTSSSNSVELGQHDENEILTPQDSETPKEESSLIPPFALPKKLETNNLKGTPRQSPKAPIKLDNNQSNKTLQRSSSFSGLPLNEEKTNKNDTTPPPIIKQSMFYEEKSVSPRSDINPITPPTIL